MEQTVVRRLKDGTLAAYRAAAKQHGRSLEAELRDVIERHAPRAPKDTARLLALSERMRAKTIGEPGDSTAFIRWMRDTNGGRLADSLPFEAGDGDH